MVAQPHVEVRELAEHLAQALASGSLTVDGIRGGIDRLLYDLTSRIPPESPS